MRAGADSFKAQHARDIAPEAILRDGLLRGESHGLANVYFSYNNLQDELELMQELDYNQQLVSTMRRARPRSGTDLS